MAERNLWSMPFHWGDSTRVGQAFDDYAGTGGSGNGRAPASSPWDQEVRSTYEQGAHPESGLAVGGWVPFANYLNTQSNPDLHTVKDVQPTSDEPAAAPAGPVGLGPPGGGPHGGGGSQLVSGPGLGGYYGQLSQQYLTGKRQ